MSLALEMQDDIAELLDDPDIGRTFTITRTTPGAYNEADGSTGAATTQQWTTRGLLLNFRDGLIDGTVIKKGDRKLFLKLKGSTYEAAEQDVVTAGTAAQAASATERYAVANHKRIELGGTAIIFIMQVRR